MKTLLFLFLSIVSQCTLGFAAVVETPAGCPSSLFPLNLAVFGQSCFQFNFEKSDWEVARNQCLSDGGDLIQIRTEPLQRFLEQLLGLQKTEKTGFWIGATDKDIESKWEWVTDEKNMTYSYWQDGQGTKAGKHSPDADLDDCALMRVDYDFKWYDVPCRNKYLTYSYICQFALNGSQISSGNTNNRYMSVMAVAVVAIAKLIAL
ncbi:C-type lectin domain family 4 member E-like [Crassostrea virginica]